MPELLGVEGLCAGYGAAAILSDITFSLGAGRSLALLGRNGVGKTTLVNSLIGVTRRTGGRIRLAGSDITALSPDRRARAGIGWVPQERNIFRSLTVVENLTAVARPGPWTPERIFQLFPRLAERKKNFGTQLSGGEQQMLAIGRALVLNPKVLLLDEPTEGLAPIIVEELLRALKRLFTDEGMAGIVVEQHAQKILKMTDEAIILERGRIIHSAPSAALLADEATLAACLGVTHQAKAGGANIVPIRPAAGRSA
jgi:branched-chain amino acid transport system ATP-binding protein